MKVRIVSEPHWMWGRAYRVQVERSFKFLWWTRRWWGTADSIDVPCRSESEAKGLAEEYAKGSWVSDTATFEDRN